MAKKANGDTRHLPKYGKKINPAIEEMEGRLYDLIQCRACDVRQLLKTPMVFSLAYTLKCPICKKDDTLGFRFLKDQDGLSYGMVKRLSEEPSNRWIKCTKCKERPGDGHLYKPREDMIGWICARCMMEEGLA